MSISEEQLKTAMEQYGNLRHHLELMRSNLQTVIDKIIEKHPEIQNEIDSVKEELGRQLEEAEKVEKQQKKVLQAMIEQFSQDAVIKDEIEIKTPLLRVGLKKEVTYNSKALDGRATVDPTLMAFREEKITSRITLNKL